MRTDECIDLETGMEWRDGACADCLRLHNTSVLRKRQERLRKWLAWIYERNFDAVTNERALTAFDEI